MQTSKFRIEKVLALPSTLDPDTMYIVKDVTGSLVVFSDATGTNSFPLKVSGAIDYNDLLNLPNLLSKANLVDGLIPSNELPAYVDSITPFAGVSSFPVTGNDSTIYVDDTTKLSYRWTGTGYVEVGSAGGSPPAASISFSPITGVSSTNVQNAIGELNSKKQDKIIGAVSNLTSLDLPMNKVLVSNNSGKIAAHSEVTTVEVGMLAGARSKLQEQIDTKQAALTGSAKSIVDITLPSSKAVVTDSAGGVVTIPVSSTELNYLLGATSNIQTQLNSKATLTSSGLVQSNQLPSFVSGLTSYAGEASFPATGVSDQIYVDDSTGLSYRWSGTQYVEVGAAGGSPTAAGTLFNPYGGIVATNVQAAILEVFTNSQAKITGAATTVLTDNLTVSKVVVTDANGKLAAGEVSVDELGYVKGLTSNAQTQLDAKQAKITGAVTTFLMNDATATRVVVTDMNGKVTTSIVTTDELSHLVGLTAPIQTQLDNKQDSVTGAAATILSVNLTPNTVAIVDANGKMANSSVTATQLSYLTGATSNIQAQLTNKADLVNGVVPIAQLPSFVSDIVSFANLAALPVTGESSKIYITENDNLTYRWTGTSYVQVGQAAGSTPSAGVTIVPAGGISSSDIQSAIYELDTEKQANVTGAATTILNVNLTANRALISDVNGKVAVSTVTKDELSYLSGLTGSIQTQLSNKISYTEKTNSRVVVTDSAGNTVTSPVTTDELLMLGSTTSNIQTQLNDRFVNKGFINFAIDSLPAASAANKGWIYITENDVRINGYSAGDLAISTGTSWVRNGNVAPGTLANSKVLVTNAFGMVVTSAANSGDLLHLSNISGNIQTQLDAKATITTPVSTNTTLVAADKGKRVRVTGNVTIPVNIFADGDAVIISNNSTTVDITITMTGYTAYLDGNTTSKTSFTLKAVGQCAIMFNSGTSANLVGKSIS
jgi:hypothetical protein